MQNIWMTYIQTRLWMSTLKRERERERERECVRVRPRGL
jgi:hypothetical protein